LVDYLIIGGGFSAFSAELALKDKKFSILSHPPKLDHLPNTVNSKCSEFNKICSTKLKSFCAFSQFPKNFKLHDRNGLGGNSSIWGGFIVVDRLDSNITKSLIERGIQLAKVNGSPNYSSNNNFVRQLVDVTGKVLDCKEHIKPDYYGHFLSFKIIKNGYKVAYFDIQKQKILFLFAQKIVLCVGVVQLLNFLVRNVLSGNEKISLSEHEHTLIKSFHFKKPKITKDDFLMTFRFSAAIFHFLGLRFRSKLLDSYLNRIPIFVHQIFKTNIKKYIFRLYNTKGKLFAIDPLNSKVKEFGSSIHYHNLTIDNVHVDKYLNKYFPGLICVGMASIKKCKPGPISNSIILDAFKKLV
jgi:hypothetical protein